MLLGTSPLERSALFQFSTTVTLTALHLHSGGIGENGAVAIDAHLGQTAEPNGTGMVEVVTPPVTSPEQISVLKGLINAPHLYYVDLHTSAAPNGAIRGQTTTERLLLKADLSSTRVIPSLTSFEADASVLMTLDITRSEEAHV